MICSDAVGEAGVVSLSAVGLVWSVVSLGTHPVSRGEAFGLYLVYSVLSISYAFVVKLDVGDDAADRRRSLRVRSCLAVALVAGLSLALARPMEGNTNRYLDTCVWFQSIFFYLFGATFRLHPMLKGQPPRPTPRTVEIFLRGGTYWGVGLILLFIISLTVPGVKTRPLVPVWYMIYAIAFLLPLPKLLQRYLEAGYRIDIIFSFVLTAFLSYCVGLFFFLSTLPLVYDYGLGIVSAAVLLAQHIIALLPQRRPTFLLKSSKNNLPPPIATTPTVDEDPLSHPPFRGPQLLLYKDHHPQESKGPLADTAVAAAV